MPPAVPHFISMPMSTPDITPTWAPSTVLAIMVTALALSASSNTIAWRRRPLHLLVAVTGCRRTNSVGGISVTRFAVPPIVRCRCLRGKGRSRGLAPILRARRWRWRWLGLAVITGTCVLELVIAIVDWWMCGSVAITIWL